MGHANYKNLCDLFVDLLYAKGRLTVAQAVDAARRRGEKLQASEGEYDADTGMVGVALAEYVMFLQSGPQAARSRWGWRGRWGGEYVVPVLNVFDAKPKVTHGAVRGELSVLAYACHRPEHLMCEAAHGACADKIMESAEDQPAGVRAAMDEWAAYVRDLPEMREAYARALGDEGEDDDYEMFDRIPWKFAPGVRAAYRDVPRLTNVTH